MFECNEKMVLCYVMLKIWILARGWVNTLSVYELILIFLMTKNTVLHDNCSGT